MKTSLLRWAGVLCGALVFGSTSLVNGAQADGAGGVFNASAEPVMENADCLLCHSDEELSKEDADGNTISLFVNEAAYGASAHGANNCVACHTDLKDTHPDDELPLKAIHCADCHERQSKSYGASVHALAVKDGNGGAANCTDCHGIHNILPPTSAESPLYRANLQTTCGECHPGVADEVAQSVHGEGLAKNHREAPSCIDCHAEHRIEPLTDSSPIKIATQICSRCHASERMNTKFNLPGDRVKTFFESYHGLAAKFGSTEAANCASCHGFHKILPSSDPRSMVHKDNLVQTCGQCHPGATERFAGGPVHLDDTKQADWGSLVNRWVRRIYKVLIVLTIGGMLLHNFLAWRRKVMASYHSRNRTVVRMDGLQRLQHAILFLSFTYLVISGFALSYPDSWLGWLMGSDENFRRVSHRVAGVILMGLGVLHLVYLAVSKRGRRLVRDLWPRWKDLADFGANLRHFCKRGSPRPKFARFGYAEKSEYWAVVWGTVIMGATGLIIWFKMDVTQYLPRWAVDVATTIHFYEAVLATLAIIVWHFYHVIFDPDVYPMNWAALDGKVTKEWIDHEHPLQEPDVPVAASKMGTEKTDALLAEIPRTEIGEWSSKGDGI